MQFAEIIDGKIGQIRLEEFQGCVSVPRHARTGDTWNNGDPLKPDGTAYTDEEKQVTFEDPLDLQNALTDEEMDGLWDAAISSTPSARRTVARRIKDALGSASQIRSRSQQTKTLVAAAVGYGFVTADRARVIFQDDGIV